MSEYVCEECKPYIVKGKHCWHSMASMLSEKLTKEEFGQLTDMIDADPPAGPFWEAMVDKNAELNPELYAIYC